MLDGKPPIRGRSALCLSLSKNSDLRRFVFLKGHLLPFSAKGREVFMIVSNGHLKGNSFLRGQLGSLGFFDHVDVNSFVSVVALPVTLAVTLEGHWVM